MCAHNECCLKAICNIFMFCWLETKPVNSWTDFLHLPPAYVFIDDSWILSCAPVEPMAGKGTMLPLTWEAVQINTICLFDTFGDTYEQICYDRDCACRALSFLWRMSDKQWFTPAESNAEEPPSRDTMPSRGFTALSECIATRNKRGLHFIQSPRRGGQTLTWMRRVNTSTFIPFLDYKHSKLRILDKPGNHAACMLRTHSYDNLDRLHGFRLVTTRDKTMTSKRENKRTGQGTLLWLTSHICGIKTGQLRDTLVFWSVSALTHWTTFPAVRTLLQNQRNLSLGTRSSGWVGWWTKARNGFLWWVREDFTFDVHESIRTLQTEMFLHALVCCINTLVYLSTKSSAHAKTRPYAARVCFHACGLFNCGLWPNPCRLGVRKCRPNFAIQTFQCG